MITFLAKHFVKDYDNYNEPSVRKAYGKLAGMVGIISNLILCTMKILIGIFANSIAIIADGVNNLADASSSVITLLGFKLASMPEDKDHPYGHARYEYLTGLLISVLIIVVGFQLLKSSFAKVLNPDPLEFSWITVIVLVIAIGIKVWQAVFNISIGKKINSLALIATGTDSRNDVISTCAVLAGIIIGKLAGIQLDGIIGCLVALFILWSGIQLIRETISPLLGEAPDEELVRDIQTLVLKEERVLGTHDLIVHNYGPGKVFASIHIEVDSRGSIMEIHEMIDDIEMMVKRELNIEFVAHMDPIELDNPIVDNVYRVVVSAIQQMDGVLGIHDLRVVPGKDHTNVIFDVVLSTECTMTKEQIHCELESVIKMIDPKYNLVANFDLAYHE